MIHVILPYVFLFPIFCPLGGNYPVPRWYGILFPLLNGLKDVFVIVGLHNTDDKSTFPILFLFSASF